MVNAALSCKFTLALVQMSMDEDVETNINHAIGWCEKAVRQGAQVICLPELFSSRYFCQREDTSRFRYAEPVHGPLTALFARFSKENAVVIIVPFFERRCPGVYHNSALVIDADGAPLGLYRKMHIPDDPAYYEKFYFAPGDLGFRLKTQYGSIARSSVGINGILKRHARRVARGRVALISHSHRMASRKDPSVRHKRTRGARCNGAMPLPAASMWARPTGWL